MVQISIFFFLNRGIILWIELPWPENPANTYARLTETLDSCFDSGPGRDRVLCKEYGCNLQDTFRLIGCVITMIG